MGCLYTCEFAKHTHELMAIEPEHSGHVKQIATVNLHLQLGILELSVLLS
jgi:hypothetical protein